jgi:hypothetical protein
MHDRNGTLLKAGDRVIVEAVISSVQADGEFCNITLQCTAPLKQAHMRMLTTNAGACSLVERTEAVDIPGTTQQS